MTLTSVQGFILLKWLEIKAVMVPATHTLDTITKNSIPFALLLQDCQQGVIITWLYKLQTWIYTHMSGY